VRVRVRGRGSVEDEVRMRRDEVRIRSGEDGEDRVRIG
jgi:hypothetical protein